MEDIIEFLKRTPPFQFLDDDVLKRLAESITIEFYPKGTMILHQDGPPSAHLWLIAKGGTKVFRKGEPEGEAVIDYRSEGDSFGFLSLMGADKSRASVQAIEDTICYLFEKDAVIYAMDKSPAFTEYFLKYFLGRFIDKTYEEMKLKSMLIGTGDKALFTTLVGEFATKDLVTASTEITIREAASLMAQKGVSSLVLLDREGVPAGIITDRDLREKVVARGRDTGAPAREIMSVPLIKVDSRDYSFEALLKMVKYGIHHLLVVENGILKGIITNHDLMMIQGRSPLSLVKEIEGQHDIQGLVPVSSRINGMVGLLLREGARASNITRIITEVNDRLVRKVLEAAERKFGKPPVEYCWIAYGSEGRKEQTFKTDQDNAIIYDDPASDREAKEAEGYFGEFTQFVRDSLVICGFPPCPADYMASNPRWHQPLGVWREYVSGWIGTPTPEAILKSLIFFDFRPVYGGLGLAESLRAHIGRSLKGQNVFLALMAGAITKNRPPLGFIRTFAVEKSGEHKDEFNIKLRGIGPLVDLVRLFALESGCSQTATLERLREMKDSHPAVREMGRELEEAFEILMLLRIHHQLKQIESGIAPDNFINPGKLSSLEKKSIKEAFGVISKAQDIVIENYRAGLTGS